MAESVFSGFEWKIKNVISINSLQSEEFVLYEFRWRLRLRVDAKGFIRFYLTKLNAGKLNWTSKIRTFIQDPTENSTYTSFVMLDDPYFTTEEIWWIHRYELLGESDRCLTDGTLTFVIVFTCRNILEKDAMGVKVSDKSIQTSVNEDMGDSLESLSLDLHRLLDDGVQSDVTLKCGERSFPAHKGILSARSEVFSAMFRSDMAESRTGVIQISDMDASILDQFLQYIYSGKLSDLSIDTAPKLYATADKYSVESLKKSCSEFMEENLTKENACKILVLADTHGDKRLTDCVLRFITDVELVQNKEMWVEFHSEHPKLASEMLYRAYQVKCVSRVN